jgi:hypothetical protein
MLLAFLRFGAGPSGRPIDVGENIHETYSVISEMCNSQYMSNMPDKSIDILNNC